MTSFLPRLHTYINIGVLLFNTDSDTDTDTQW